MRAGRARNKVKRNDSQLGIVLKQKLTILLTSLLNGVQIIIGKIGS